MLGAGQLGAIALIWPHIGPAISSALLSIIRHHYPPGFQKTLYFNKSLPSHMFFRKSSPHIQQAISPVLLSIIRPHFQPPETPQDPPETPWVPLRQPCNLCTIIQALSHLMQSKASVFCQYQCTAAHTVYSTVHTRCIASLRSQHEWPMRSWDPVAITSSQSETWCSWKPWATCCRVHLSKSECILECILCISRNPLQAMWSYTCIPASCASIEDLCRQCDPIHTCGLWLCAVCTLFRPSQMKTKCSYIRHQTDARQ